MRAFADAGGVIYAECGGMIYLSHSLQSVEGLPADMGMQPAMFWYAFDCCVSVDLN